MKYSSETYVGELPIQDDSTPTKVVNCSKDKYDIYIGRPSQWGNPFIIGKDGTREEVIQKFREYGEKTGLKERAKTELKGHVLGCWCKPKACHGDVLVEWINEDH